MASHSQASSTIRTHASTHFASIPNKTGKRLFGKTPPSIQNFASFNSSDGMIPEEESTSTMVVDNESSLNVANRPLAVMQAASFLFMLGMSTLALSPAEALKSALGSEKATSLLSKITAGTALMQIFLSPWTGSVLDAVGRRKAVIAFLTVASLGTAITSFRPGVETVCLTKIITSLCVPQFFVAAQAILGDVTASDPTRMGSIMGFQFALISSAYLIGGVIAGRLADFGLPLRYGVSATLVSLAALLTTLRLPETLAPSKRVPFHFTVKKALQSPLSCVQLLLRRGGKIRLIAILLLLQSAPMHMGDVLQIFATKHWNLSVKQFSNTFVLFGLCGVLANIISTLLVSRLGLKNFTILASTSAMLFPIGASMSHKAAIIGGCAGFLGSSQMLATTAALTGEGTKSGLSQGEIAGERASLLSLLRVVGPLVYNGLYLHGSKSGMPHLPFIFNAGLSFTSLCIGILCLS